MSEISRRSFLKTSALGAAAAIGAEAVLASAKDASSSAPAANPAPAPAPANSAQPASGETFRLTREIPVESGYDLVVAGGGPAGTAAAVCAARLGARVLLAEATGCLGGMGTSGLVTEFDPMSNGKEMLVGGLMREIVTTMHKRGFLAPQVTEDYYTKRYHCWTPFRVEGYKLVLDELVTAAGIDMRFFTRVVEADVDAASHTVRGVILHNIEGLRYIRAKAFIDATGDAVLTALCGAPYREAGRDTPNIMPPTLCSLAGGIDFTVTAKNLGRQQQLIEKAIADGHFSQHDRHVPGMFRVGNSTGSLNTGHIFKMNAVKCRSLSDGVMRGRRLVQEYVSFYQKYMPGCENIELVTTGSLVGVRESRRIVGEYELNFNDYISRRQFPDQIAVFNKAVDIHVYDDSEAEYQRYLKEYTQTGRLNPGECYGIPYGILVPRGWRNLWVAGRCNSSDVKVHGSIRVQPAASMMGQAAGTAAVQSIATGEPACDLDTAHLVETLRKAGAHLPQETLSRKMTRAQG